MGENGPKLPPSIAKLMAWLGVIVVLGGSGAVLRNCVSGTAGLVGIQTTEAAAEVQRVNMRTHESIRGEVLDNHEECTGRANKVEQRVQHVDEAVLQVLEAVSPRRAKELKKKRGKR
jgi:hypothetical protein